MFCFSHTKNKSYYIKINTCHVISPVLQIRFQHCYEVCLGCWEHLMGKTPTVAAFCSMERWWGLLYYYSLSSYCSVLISGSVGSLAFQNKRATSLLSRLWLCYDLFSKDSERCISIMHAGLSQLWDSIRKVWLKKALN